MSNTPQRDPQGAPIRDDHFPDSNRRRFLMLGAGAAGATAAAPLLAAPAALVDVPEAKPQSSGYRETEHVRDYYATTRI